MQIIDIEDGEDWDEDSGGDRQTWTDMGYNDAIDDAVALVRETLGDRVVAGRWIPGSPTGEQLVQALLLRKKP